MWRNSNVCSIVLRAWRDCVVEIVAPKEGYIACIGDRCEVTFVFSLNESAPGEFYLRVMHVSASTRDSKNMVPHRKRKATFCSGGSSGHCCVGWDSGCCQIALTNGSFHCFAAASRRILWVSMGTSRGRKSEGKVVPVFGNL